MLRMNSQLNKKISSHNSPLKGIKNQPLAESNSQLNIAHTSIQLDKKKISEKSTNRYKNQKKIHKNILKNKKF